VPAVHIIAQQIPGLSRTLNLEFQDFPGPNSFSGTFQVLETLQTQFQDFTKGVGTLRLQKQLYDSVSNHWVNTRLLAEMSNFTINNQIITLEMINL